MKCIADEEAREKTLHKGKKPKQVHRKGFSRSYCQPQQAPLTV
jgi:hypothetical protein